MGPEAPAHQHPAPFLIRKFTGTAGVKKLVLGRHDASQNGQTDGSAVEMARKGQIRPQAAYSSKNMGEWARRMENRFSSGFPRALSINPGSMDGVPGR